MSDPEPARPKARRPRGFQDRRGRDLAAERAIVETVLGVYQRWGFERLETAAFEYADALGKFLPDQDRPNEGVFAVQDDDGQWLALRYDLTAPLARFAAEHFEQLPKPYRRCAAGPVWRNEKPGPGRFREFWQCDADTVGAPGPEADAEMIAMACEAFEAVLASAGLRNKPVIKVSHRGLLDGVLESLVTADGALDPRRRMIVLRAIDKVDRLGADGVRALLTGGRLDESGDFTPGAGLDDAQADLVTRFASGVGRAHGASEDETDGILDDLAREMAGSDRGRSALADLRAIRLVLRDLVPDDRWRVDTSVVRGLEYYTGAVFEATIPSAGHDFGSVGGGGRYDGLVSRFRGQPVPATGFSIGVSRLAAALAADPAGALGAADGPVVVLPFDREAIAEAFALAARLRGGLDRPVEVYLGGAGPKAQLKYADRRRAPVAVILGGDERAAGAVTLKDLRIGAALSQAAGADRDAYQAAQADAQRTVPQAEMVSAVAALLARGRP